MLLPFESIPDPLSDSYLFCKYQVLFKPIRLPGYMYKMKGLAWNGLNPLSYLAVREDVKIPNKE